MIIGTGVDITEVKRLRHAVEKWGESFLQKVFTEQEIANAKARGSVMFLHLAGRFAAKEAVFKALGDKDISWKDLEILNDLHGKPYCLVLNKKKRRGVHIHLSISHVKSYAVANAVVTKET